MHDTTSEFHQETHETADRLVNIIRNYGVAGIAFSGGVDSAVVAQAAFLADPMAVAITAISPSLAEKDLIIARQVAQQIGIRHEEIATREFERKQYRANATNRCYFCKDTLYRLAETRLAALGVTCLLNGANTDDLGDFRPGMQAAREHNVHSPLIDAGLNKADVRTLARFWKLSVSEKPASPCLSSRIAYGVEVTPERVKRIELAESFLAKHVADSVRVRLEQDDVARIEVELQHLHLLTSAPLRTEMVTYLRQLGFARITLDLEGFRSGSMNDSIAFVSLGDV